MLPVYTPRIARNQEKYVLDCVRSNMLTFRGKYVKLFEDSVAEFLGAKHCVATFNGSVSLFMMYRAAGLVGQRVLTSTMTYAATVSQLILAGVEPILLDCDNNFQIDIAQVAENLRWRNDVSAVVVPALYADAPNMQELRHICDQAGVWLLEDAAEAFGCRDKSKNIGTYGQMSSFSFFANKVVTCGEGGCVVTDDDRLADWMRKFRNQNQLQDYYHAGPGTNFRMTNIQAAIGLAQMEEVAETIQKKRRIANQYRAGLHCDAVHPVIDFSSEWMPIFKLPSAVAYKDFQAYCESQGVETRPAFVPIHRMSGFLECEHGADLSVSESLANAHFILPCSPELSHEEIRDVIDIVNKF